MSGPPKSPPLRIAYFVSLADETHRGLHRFILREIESLQARGVHIELFVTRPGKGHYMPPSGTKIHFWNPWTLPLLQLSAFLSNPGSYWKTLLDSVQSSTLVDFLLAGSFRPFLAQMKPDCLHAHFGDHKLYTASYCARASGLAIAVTIHAYELYMNPRPAFLPKALQQCDLVVTVSHYNERILADQYGVPPTKILVNYLSIPDVEMKGMLAAPPPPAATRLNLLMVGRFVLKKGHRTALEAMKKLEATPVDLIIAGSGPLPVAQWVKDRGLEARVSIVHNPTEAELADLFRSCHIFLQPSQTRQDGYTDREGIPVTLMEAMAYGRPIIATRHAGIPELLAEILIPEGNAEALANAILSISADPERRLDLGERNRSRVRELCSERNIDVLWEALRRIARR